MNRRIAGFTLIELLIVVAIIGILAAIAVPNFLNAQSRAKAASSLANMRSMGTAVESLRIDTNMVPMDSWDVAYSPIYDKKMRLYRPLGFTSQTDLYNIENQWSILTSPIAYMGSLPKDPFARTVIGDSGREFGNLYTFADNSPYGSPDNEDHGIWYYTEQYNDRTGVQWLRPNEWLIMGWGPRGPQDIGQGGRGVTSAGSSSYLPGMPYDSSNGLVSDGDIVFRN